MDGVKSATYVLLLKWAILGLFFIYFCLFEQTLQLLQQIVCEKMFCPSSI